MAQIISPEITVDELISILKDYSDQGFGKMMIDIIHPCAECEGHECDHDYYDIAKIKVSNTLDIYIEDQ